MPLIIMSSQSKYQGWIISKGNIIVAKENTQQQCCCSTVSLIHVHLVGCIKKIHHKYT